MKIHKNVADISDESSTGESRENIYAICTKQEIVDAWKKICHCVIANDLRKRQTFQIYDVTLTGRCDGQTFDGSIQHSVAFCNRCCYRSCSSDYCCLLKPR